MTKNEILIESFPLGRLKVHDQVSIADKFGVIHVVSRGLGEDVGTCFVCGAEKVKDNFVTQHMSEPLCQKLLEWYPKAEHSYYRGQWETPRINFHACPKHKPILQAMHDHINKNMMNIIGSKENKVVQRNAKRNDQKALYGQPNTDYSMCRLEKDVVDKIIWDLK